MMYQGVNVEGLEAYDRKRFGRIYRESELLPEGAVIVIDQSTKEWLGFHEGKAEHQASPDRPLILFGDHSCKMQLMIEPFSLAENVIPFTSKGEMPIIFLYYLVHSLVETTEYKRHWTDKELGRKRPSFRRVAVAQTSLPFHPSL